LPDRSLCNLDNEVEAATRSGYRVAATIDRAAAMIFLPRIVVRVEDFSTASRLPPLIVPLQTVV
jgi:hypothetical protein